MRNKYFNWNRNKIFLILTRETTEMLIISIKTRPGNLSTGFRNVPALAKNTQATRLNICVW